MSPRPGMWRTALAAALLLSFATPVSASPLGASVDYLSARQDAATGGFSSGAAGSRPSAAYSAWAAMAVAANREDPRRWRPARRSLAYAATRLRDDAPLSDVLRAAVAAKASGLRPRSALAVDPVVAVDQAIADGTLLAGSTTQLAWAIFALRASDTPARDPRVASAVAVLRAAQASDGGWVSAGQSRSDVITTATVVQALVAGGVRAKRDAALISARDYLTRALRRDGGFGVRRGRRSRTIPSAWAALAIRSLGEVSGKGRWRRGGGPTAYLGRVSEPSGAVRRVALAPGDPARLAQVLTTLALAGRPLPFVRRGRMRVVRHTPSIVAREPAPGGTVGALLIARYRDDTHGGGVDPASVRVFVDGQNVSRSARATRFAVQLRSVFVPPGRVTVEVRLADYAGNVAVSRWAIRGPSGGR